MEPQIKLFFQGYRSSLGYKLDLPIFSLLNIMQLSISKFTKIWPSF